MRRCTACRRRAAARCRPLTAAFPGTVEDGVLDRAELRALVLRDDEAMHRLEAIMHPLVHQEEAKFRAAAFRAGRRAVVLDIPLLFETGAENRFDTIVIVSAPRDVQMARVPETRAAARQIEAIIARQMPDAEKRRRADMVVPTGLSKFHAMRDGPPHHQGADAMSRSVLFDTETTGFDPLTGDRVIEIAAIELINDLPTGKQFHVLIDPERDIPAESTRVHGITNAHVEGKPKFAEIAEDMLAFFGDAPLVAHNAPFDFGFIDAELPASNAPPRPGRGWSTRWCWRRPAFPACPTAWTRCAAASTSTSRRAPRITRCSTAGCWRKSMSS